MTAIVDTPEEAAELPLAPLLVRRPLEAHLDEHGLGAGPLEAERVGEGHSNITYLIRRGADEWVLRRPPRPPLPPSAHDVMREARLLQAVQGADVRTPRVVLACDDESVIGAPFYVMERVEGDVIVSEIPRALDTPPERGRIAEELIDALVEIHAVDWQACGLEGYGRPTGYLDRQLRRFSGLWAHNQTRDVPEVDEAARWLAEHRPESGAATIGDPLADLGYLTATYAEPDDGDSTPLFALNAVTSKPGFPSRDELIARYEERSGRSMRDVRWYQTLALWKSAVFLEGSYKRLLAGTTDDPWFKLLADGVPAVARRALEIARAG